MNGLIADGVIIVAYCQQWGWHCTEDSLLLFTCVCVNSLLLLHNLILPRQRSSRQRSPRQHSLLPYLCCRLLLHLM